MPPDPRRRPIDYEAALRRLRTEATGSTTPELTAGAAIRPRRWWRSARFWGWIASIHGTLIALLLLAVVTPLSIEATASHCSALEQRFLRTTGPGGSAGGTSAEAARLAPGLRGLATQPVIDGSSARRVMRAWYPERPAWVGCLVSYWWMLLGPARQGES